MSREKTNRNIFHIILMAALIFTVSLIVSTAETHAFSGEGSGTEGAPYLISSSDDWDDFVAEVRMGDTDGFYKLTRDITIENSVGTSTNPFTGHFDGNSHKITAAVSDTAAQGTAPFRYICDAEIKDLKADGMVRGGDHSAGLVGFALKGNGPEESEFNIIRNVTVSTTINGGEYAGGIVGHGKTSVLKLYDCQFNGEINGGSKYTGGLLGWSDGQKLTIDNCIFCGSYKGSGKFHPIAVKNAGAKMVLNISNAYYASTAAPDMQDDTSRVVTNDGIITYAKNEADITAGHFYKLVKIGGNSTNHYYQINVSIKMGKDFYQNTDNSITYEVKVNDESLAEGTDFTTEFTQVDSPNIPLSIREVLANYGTYVIAVNGKNDYLGKETTRFVVSGITGNGTESDPYLISGNKAWDELSDMTRMGNGTSLEGKYLKLTANITVAKMIGTEANPFRGTFDGQNKTITCNISEPSVKGAAPFNYIKGATIKNVVVKGTVTGGESSAGLVGFALGENNDVVNTINNAIVSTNVNAADYGAGVVGHAGKSTLVIKDSVYSGKVTGTIYNRRYHSAGFMGNNDGAFLKMENCINKGSKGEIYWWNGIGLGNCRGYDVKTTYYLDSLDRGDKYGATTHVPGSIMVYTSALSGKISTKAKAADGVTYYYDDDVKITGVEPVYAYTGSNINVAYDVVRSGGAKLVKDTDYTAKFNATVKAKGSYNLTITGKGNYTGSISVSFKVADNISGSGTEADPYKISSASDWEKFKYYVDNGHTYKGEFVKLTADISVGNKMAGKTDAPFAGTFDGGGHKLTVGISNSSGSAATFASAKGAKIKDLTVAGTVTGGNHTAGLIGEVKGGPVEINGVTVAATVSSKQYLGGFIGHSYEEIVKFRNCIFSGELKCTGDEAYGGGFAGWSDRPDYGFTDCLCTGKATGKYKLFHPAGVFFSGGTGYMGERDGTVYYTTSSEVIGASSYPGYPLRDWNVHIKHVYNRGELESEGLYKPLKIGDKSINCFTKADSSSIIIEKVFVKSANEAISPEPKIEYNKDESTDLHDFTIKYYRNGSEVTGNITEPGEYMATAIANGPDYYGSVRTGFKVISFAGHGTADDPYRINNGADWKSFADALASGHTFKGEYVKLTSDITIQDPVGNTEYPFCGTFDGSGLELRANIQETGMQGTAPFRAAANGAVIRNVNVSGEILGGQHEGGLVGFAYSGKVEIIDVIVSADIYGGTYAGGIVGHGKKSDLTIRNSAYTGKITGGSNYAGGLLGWSDGQKLTINGCIFSGQFFGTGSFHPIAVRDPDTGMNTNISRVYYVNTQTPDIENRYIAAKGSPVYTKTTFPEDKLLSGISAADGKTYFALTNVGSMAANYEITGNGITPVPAVTDVEGVQLQNSKDYAAEYIKDGDNQTLDKITEEGTYTAVLKGNKTKTVGSQRLTSFTTTARNVQNVSLNKESVSLSMDQDKDTAQLEAAITPASAVIKEVRWSVGDENIATVSEDGLVTAKAIGSTTVTVTVEDEAGNTKSAECAVSVNKTEAEMIVLPSKNILTYNQEYQALINPGTAYGGTVVYKKSTDSEFTESIPTGKYAGEYTVNYKIIGDEYHLDSQVQTMIVNIAKAPGNIVITKQASVKTGQRIDLTNLAPVGSLTTATFTIKEGDETGSSISNRYFNAGDPGTCTVNVKIGERADFLPQNEEIVITIEQKDVVDVAVTMQGWTYGEQGSEPSCTLPASVQDVTYMYSGTMRNGDYYSDIPNLPTEAGTYQAYVWAEDAENIYFGWADFEIAPKDIGNADVTLEKTLTYNGEEQVQSISKVMLGSTDITQFCVNGGNYAAEDYDPAADELQYTVKNAGEYVMVVNADETSNYTGSVEKEFTVAKADPTFTAPAAAENLVYNESEQLLVQPGTVQGGVFIYNMGSGNFTEKLPTAIEAGTYRVNFRIRGDSNHNDINDDNYVEVTIDSNRCTVGIEPEAKEDLVYNGEEQELITAGASADGDMVYRIGDDEGAEFSADIPAAKNAGDYRIYYKAVARDNNHADSDIAYVDVTIAKAVCTVDTEPAAIMDLEYTGKEQSLVTEGEASGGTIEYSLDENEGFSEDVPAAVNAGTYTVYYRVKGDADYDDSGVFGPIEVVVNKAPFPGGITQHALSANYKQDVDISGLVSGADVEYSLDFDDTENHDCVFDPETGILTTGTGDGRCWIKITAKGDTDENYESDYVFVAVSDMEILDIDVHQDNIVFSEGNVDPQYEEHDGIDPDTVTFTYSGTINNGEFYGMKEGEAESAPTEAGTYSVFVFYTVDNRAYYGSADFAINPADISGAAVTLGDELKYNGVEQTQEVSSITLNGADITDQCAVSDNSATVAGDYELTIKPSDDAYNIYGTAKAPFTIYPDDETMGEAKAGALSELDKFDSLAYSGDTRAAVEKALEEARSAIENAKTLDEINQIKANTESVIAKYKKTNTLNVEGKTAEIKYSKVKKRARKLKVSRVLDFVDQGQGNITYVKKKGNKKITIAKKTGKVKVKKKLKKGTYKVIVDVRAAGNNSYEAGTMTVTFEIKVK